MSQVPAWFDDKAYFANKMAQVNETATTQYEAADFAAALKAAGVDPNNPESLYNHFVNFGNAEGVSPNGYFDADAYIANKAAQAGSTVEAVEQAFKDAGLSAWDHYQAFGTKEGINPSASFNTDEYLQAKVDYELAKGNSITLDQLKATLAENNLSALEHYYLYGQAEGVSYSPADYPAFPAIPVDGGYDPLPTAGKTVAEAEAGLGDGSLTAGSFYIQDDVAALNGAKFTVINSAKGIYVADSVDNLSASNAAGILAQADHVIIADSFANLAMKELPSFGDTPTSLLVDSAVPSKINLGDVTVAKAADAQNTLNNFLARSDVEYATGVTKPTELTVGTYSIKDTAAAVVAADATLLDDASTVTVADTVAALTANFGSIEGKSYQVEVLDSLDNIANASTTILKGLDAEFSTGLSLAATDSGAVNVDYTSALQYIVSESLTIDTADVTSMDINLVAANATTGGSISATKIATLFSNANTEYALNGSNQGDIFTLDSALTFSTIDGGAGADELSVANASSITELVAGTKSGQFDNIEKISLDTTAASTVTKIDLSESSVGVTVDASTSGFSSGNTIILSEFADTITLKKDDGQASSIVLTENSNGVDTITGVSGSDVINLINIAGTDQTSVGSAKVASGSNTTLGGTTLNLNDASIVMITGADASGLSASGPTITDFTKMSEVADFLSAGYTDGISGNGVFILQDDGEKTAHIYSVSNNTDNVLKADEITLVASVSGDALTNTSFSVADLS